MDVDPSKRNMLALVEALNQKGFKAAYEYPGFVLFAHEGKDYAIGDTNGYWTCDIHDGATEHKAGEGYLGGFVGEPPEEDATTEQLMAWIENGLKHPPQT